MEEACEKICIGYFNGAALFKPYDDCADKSYDYRYIWIFIIFNR